MLYRWRGPDTTPLPQRAGVSNLMFGLPDLGFLGLTDLVRHTRMLTTVTKLPIVVDADTGFGGPLAVFRAMRELQEAGAAAIQLEDQVAPKRCGHFDGKSLVACSEMVAKISAACDARESGTVLIARTDAIAVEGLEAAMDRARTYSEAGADVIFVEAPRSLAELKAIGSELGDLCLMVNVVEGGQTPELSVRLYAESGYSLVYTRTRSHA